MAQNDSANFTHLDGLSAAQLKRLLVEQLTRQKLGLYWEHDSLDRDRAINEHVVLPRVVPELCHRDVTEDGTSPYRNLIIEGDNFDSLRMLRATHAGKIRVIYIDPPYNTGNKDWVYNDRYIGQNDRWRHSLWLEFLYRRLTLARDLLTPDGVIMVSINDENRSRLELLMDEVLPGRRLGSIVWRTRQGSNADQTCFLSLDHEHVLVYGNGTFSFNGFEKSYEMYANPDNDPRGEWRIGDITLGFSYKERPNLYYPLVDPKTGIAYPCSPESVWRYATEARLRMGQQLQAKSMEEFIALGQIIFPANPRVETWATMDALLAAIERGDVPKGGKSLLLRADLPGLEYWVGKPVGFGRPQFKRYKADLRNKSQPLSSWIVPSFEQGAYESEGSLVAATNQEGARQVTELFGDRAFNYAKPVSLLKGLLQQATGPNDIVLDFFAGSGTTGQAVLELNAEDGGNRRFILCSSTEANSREKEKNICRDICAERLRRVTAGHHGKRGLGGSFAYLRLDHVEQPDVAFDATSDNASALLALRLTHKALPPSKEPVQLIASDPEGGVDTVFVPVVDEAAIEILSTWPSQRVAVYSPRPDTVVELLAARGRDVNSYGLQEALLRGQTRARRTAKANQAIEPGGRHE